MPTSINSQFASVFSLQNTFLKSHFTNLSKNINMGEAKNEVAKNDGEKKVDAGGPIPTVLKFDMHCEGCIQKVKRFLKHMEGVESIKADIKTNKLTVNGKADPTKLRDKLAERIGKNVELISPLPSKVEAKKDGGGDKKGDDKPEKKSDDKSEKKSDDKKVVDKKPEIPTSTVVLKIYLHCEGCIQKVKRHINKYKGVETVNVDAQKHLVTVKGKMDIKTLIPFLQEKVKGPVDIVPAKKDETAPAGGDKKEKAGDLGSEKKDKEKEGAKGGGEKKDKEKEGAGGGGDKKDKAIPAAGGGGGGDSVKVEANKMEYYGTYGYQQPAPSYWYGGPEHVYGQSQMMHAGPSHSEYGVGPSYHQNYGVEQHYTMPPYQHQPYAPQHYNMPPYQHQEYASQMFSEENPNACSVM